MKGDQAITSTRCRIVDLGDPPFVVFATGGASGNPVTFTASGACGSSGLNGDTIALLAPGVCTVTASQAGSTIYNAAADVVRTFTVNETIAPVATPVQSPGATAGWNNTDVTVTWNWTDAGGPASTLPVHHAAACPPAKARASSLLRRVPIAHATSARPPTC